MIKNKETMAYELKIVKNGVKQTRKKKKNEKENHKNNKEDFNDRKNGTLLSMEQIQYFVNLKPILMKGYE